MSDPFWKAIERELADWNEFRHQSIMHMNHLIGCKCDRFCRKYKTGKRDWDLKKKP